MSITAVLFVISAVAVTLPTGVFGFTIIGYNLPSATTSVASNIPASELRSYFLKSHHVLQASSNAKNDEKNVDDAFDQLRENLEETKGHRHRRRHRLRRDDINNEEVLAVSKTKQWINRICDLSADLNREVLADSEQEAERKNEKLRQNQARAIKAIDLFASLTRELANMDDDWESVGTADEEPWMQPNAIFTDNTGNEVMAAATMTTRENSVPLSSENDVELVYSIREDDTRFQLELALPGVARDDLHIELEKSGGGSKSTTNLVIRGLFKPLGSDKPTTFSQRFVLASDVDVDRLDANLARGILSVSAPKIVEKEKDTTTKRILVTTKENN